MCWIRLNQNNPVCTFAHYLSAVRFNVLLPSTPEFREWFLLFSVYDTNIRIPVISAHAAFYTRLIFYLVVLPGEEQKLWSSELRPFTFWQSDTRYYSALYSQTLPIYVFPLRWEAKFRTQKTNVKIILIFRRQIAGSHINVHWMARNVVLMHSALNLWYSRFWRRLPRYVIE